MQKAQTDATEAQRGAYFSAVSESHRALHARLSEACVEALLADTRTLGEVDAHALEGCSACARALASTREISVDLAETRAPPAVSAGLRARVLDAAKGRRAPSISPSPSVERSEKGSRAADPSFQVASLHRHQAHEAPRLAELQHFAERLEAIAPQCDALLEKLASETGFAIHFVSIVREGRVYALAQRGLPESLAAYREIRREASFCTHTVNIDAPLIVEDAAREPFFRRSKMVERFGIRAYVGAPVHAPSGIALGTVCALDFVPRRVTPSLVRAVRASAAEVAGLLTLQGPSVTVFSSASLHERGQGQADALAPAGPASGLDVEGTNESPRSLSK